MSGMRMGVQKRKSGGYRVKREIIDDFAEVLRRATLIYSYIETQDVKRKSRILDNAKGIINVAKRYVE